MALIDEDTIPTESHDLELWWGISRSEYLTIPRSIILNMPIEWQNKFAELLHELDSAAEWRPTGEKQYWVTLGIYDEEKEEVIDVPDPLQEYRHGNDVADSLFRDANRKR